jgi:hypothetical protein
MLVTTSPLCRFVGFHVGPAAAGIPFTSQVMELLLGTFVVDAINEITES